jgi:hypothetical protein
MIPELRQAFNAAWSEQRYRSLLGWLEAEAGLAIPFHIAETPVFLPAALTAELERAAHQVVEAVRSPEYLRQAARAVPPEYQVPGEDEHPRFLQVDLAVSTAGGEPRPRLIELQGFPSLYAFQWLLHRGYRRHFSLPAGMTPYFAGLDDGAYVECLRRTIVGDADPRTVVLLEVEPEQQKTRVDFVMTEKLLGVPTIAPGTAAARCPSGASTTG